MNQAKLKKIDEDIASLNGQKGIWQRPGLEEFKETQDELQKIETKINLLKQKKESLLK